MVLNLDGVSKHVYPGMKEARAFYRRAVRFVRSLIAGRPYTA
jgi:hypothetical protein